MNKNLFQAIPSIFGFAILLLLTSCSAGKKAQNAVYQPLDNSLLWEISGKDLKKPSYLFGTIHMIPADQFFWTDPMKKAFADSEEIVFELDMNEMNDMSKIMGMMQHLFMQNDTTLADLLTKNEYDQVAEHFKTMGLPIMLFERMKPFFLTVFLSEDFAKGSIQDGTLKSYEFELNEMAINQNKTTSGLETIEFQASMFDKIPYKTQAKMLMETLNSDQESEGDTQLDQMVRLYTQQDIEGLNTLIHSSEGGEDSNWEENLLYIRNTNWIGLMAPLMKDKSTFFAVGAGHLPGDKGVIHLLRKEGYKVKPIK